VEPIDASNEALDDLDPAVDDTDLRSELKAVARAARQVAPDCVGVSIATVESGLTFTLVATELDIAALDGVQYLAGGPCVDATAREEVVVGLFGDPATESGWQVFSQASAAKGVRSTLTLPIMHGGRATGSVNLYGATVDAFDGRHEELAEVFGAWAPGAITNADLAFDSRLEAQQAPRLVRERVVVDTAVGILAARSHLDEQRARDRLAETAARAGVPVLRLAALIVETG
jgi:GAF domain-containing protein